MLPYDGDYCVAYDKMMRCLSVVCRWAEEVEHWFPFLAPSDIHLIKGNKDKLYLTNLNRSVFNSTVWSVQACGISVAILRIGEYPRSRDTALHHFLSTVCSCWRKAVVVVV